MLTYQNIYKFMMCPGILNCSKSNSENCESDFEMKEIVEIASEEKREKLEFALQYQQKCTEDRKIWKDEVFHLKEKLDEMIKMEQMHEFIIEDLLKKFQQVQLPESSVKVSGSFIFNSNLILILHLTFFRFRKIK